MMKAAFVEKAGGNFVVAQKPIPEPTSREVRIRVKACGICHGDVVCKGGYMPGINYPRCPGHEVAGVIDKMGSEVSEFKVGEHVGVGWHGGHCFQCERCRRGDFINCKNGKICGIHYDGGYSQYIVVPFEALIRIPNEFSFFEAAPLVCAGVTVYNSLRNSNARAGDLVAVQGIGGLGHLGIQFANKMGFRVVAVSSGSVKKDLALKLGAHIYVDSTSEDPVKVLQTHGGASVILATAPDANSINSLINGLSPNGTLFIIAAPHESLKVNSHALIQGRKAVKGWSSGTPIDSEDTLKFAALTNIRSMNEVFPLEKVTEAFNAMLTNKVRFRAVLDLQ